jgi:ankyrin repeat protein
MCEYGGNPINFACYFGGVAALRALFNSSRTRDLINLNSPALRCRRSGFLPVHTAVAGGNPEMYEFLVTLPGVPERLQRVANPTIKTRPRNPLALKLTALQLAFWRGDATMVQFVIEQRSRFQWR